MANAMDGREFLGRYEAVELQERGILRGTTRLLGALSIEPLIDLMTEAGVTRIEFEDKDWFLGVDGTFQNRESNEAKEGKLSDLSNVGNVFNRMNVIMNPHYAGGRSRRELPDEVAEAEELTFKLERSLQMTLRANLSQLEDGLECIDGGKERKIQTGRIDITAKDSKGVIVVVELKAGEATDGAIGQILGYMADLAEEENTDVRGILVASDFPRRVVYAAKNVKNLELRRYSFTFSFSIPE